MTDRERLLEQIREAEMRAGESGDYAIAWMVPSDDIGDDTDHAGHFALCHAKEAAHHALTAMALRDLLDVVGNGLVTVTLESTRIR